VAVVVAVGSAGVIALIVAYAMAAPTLGLTARFGDAVPRPGSTAVVQGRVLESDDGGLDGARIEARRGRRTAGTDEP
jgi:hypothetical protein